MVFPPLVFSRYLNGFVYLDIVSVLVEYHLTDLLT
jgi:hypothetical protein